MRIKSDSEVQKAYSSRAPAPSGRAFILLGRYSSPCFPKEPHKTNRPRSLGKVLRNRNLTYPLKYAK